MRSLVRKVTTNNIECGSFYAILLTIFNFCANSEFFSEFFLRNYNFYVFQHFQIFVLVLSAFLNSCFHCFQFFCNFFLIVFQIPCFLCLSHAIGCNFCRPSRAQIRLSLLCSALAQPGKIGKTKVLEKITYPYGLWLTGSGARRLRGTSPSACRALKSLERIVEPSGVRQRRAKELCRRV